MKGWTADRSPIGLSASRGGDQSSATVLPVNAFEAESRRLERFFRIGYTPGVMDISETRVDPEFPFTLDLRKI